MCYETAQLTYRIYKEAKRLNASEQEIEALYEKYKKMGNDPMNLYHVNGFSHPKMLSFTKENDELDIKQRTWGLIPHWVKDNLKAKDIMDSTLLSRAESMSDKPSFREAVSKTRCIIPLDGFYEHFHKNGKSYPHFIKSRDNHRLFVGGLTSKWLDNSTGELIETFSIVTTKANEFMSRIHNNPKLKESRMPLILNDENSVKWLDDNEKVECLAMPNHSVELESWTVNRLKGKNYVGNIKEVQNKREYEELIDPLELF